MPADKPFETIEELVALLVEERGLGCESRAALSDYLRRVNYYRFSGYARQYQRDPKHGDNEFVSDASFDAIRGIMDYDSRLRMLLQKQLAAIEIALRSMLAHELGRAHGNRAFYLQEAAYLDLNDRQGKIMDGILQDLSRSRSRTVKHYVSVTENDDMERFRDVPIWVAVEVLSFGRISNMIEYLADKSPVKATAAVLNVQWDPFGSVVHSFSVLRNLCAHHQQLWHRKLDIQCPVQRKLKPRNVKFDPASPYAAVIMLNHYRKKVDGDVDVARQIDALLQESNEFREGICLPAPK